MDIKYKKITKIVVTTEDGNESTYTGDGYIKIQRNNAIGEPDKYSVIASIPLEK